MSQLQSSGAISLNDLHQNVGGTSGTTCSLGDTDMGNLGFKSGTEQRSLSEYYGLFYHKNTITFNSSSAQWTVSWYVTQHFGVTGWSDVKWETGYQQTGNAYVPSYSAERGPAMGSVTPDSEYGRSIRINGGSLMVINGMISQQIVGYTGGPSHLAQFYIIEKKGNPGVPSIGRNSGQASVTTTVGSTGQGGTTTPLITGLTANAPSLSYLSTGFNVTGRITANVAGAGYRSGGGGGLFNGPSETVNNHLVTNMLAFDSDLSGGIQKHTYSVFSYEDYTTQGEDGKMFPTSGQVTVTFT